MITRLLMVLALLTFSLPAHAQDAESIGTIMATQGTVTIKRATADKAETAAVAQPLYHKDTIETGPDSRAIAVFNDETELALGADSLTTLDEYVYNPAAQSGHKARLSVLRGAFLYVSGEIGKDPRPDVKIEIPYGVIGLRGTSVWGGQLDQYGVFVLDGKVAVQTKRGTTLLTKGEGVDLENANSAPANRKAWGEPKITRAVETIALKDGTAAAERVKEEKARLRAARGAPPEDEASTPTEEEPTAPEAPLTPQAPAEPVAPGTPPGLAPADEATPPPLPDAPATEEEAAPATPAPAAEPENRTGFEDTENEKLQQARDAIRERRRQEQENKAP